MRKALARWAKYKDARYDKYDPHIHVREVKGSKGTGCRAPGLKTGRVHHLLSQIEYDYFTTLDSAPSVVDIREQFPLNPEETWRIAWEIPVNHQEYDDKLVIPTVDFMITVLEDGKEVLKARDIKPVKELSQKLSMGKLEITRRYFLEHHIDYALCTEEDIPTLLMNNLTNLRYDIDLTKRHIPLGMFETVREYLEEHMTGGNLSVLTSQCDNALGRPKGESLVIARHLIIKGEWNFPLDQLLFDPDATSTGASITVQSNEYLQRNTA